MTLLFKSLYSIPYNFWISDFQRPIFRQQQATLSLLLYKRKNHAQEFAMYNFMVNIRAIIMQNSADTIFFFFRVMVDLQKYKYVYLH